MPHFVKHWHPFPNICTIPHRRIVEPQTSHNELRLVDYAEPIIWYIWVVLIVNLEYLDVPGEQDNYYYLFKLQSKCYDWCYCPSERMATNNDVWTLEIFIAENGFHWKWFSPLKEPGVKFARYYGPTSFSKGLKIVFPIVEIFCPAECNINSLFIQFLKLNII